MDYLVTLQCVDQPGIVHAITTAVLLCGGNVIENQQYTDPESNLFVMRTRFESEMSLSDLEAILDSELDNFNATLMLRPYAKLKRVLILASNTTHCLRELMFLSELGEMPIEIMGVISNEASLNSLVESNGFQFTHIDVDSIGRVEAERQIQELADNHNVDLIILARYMRILSEEFCFKYPNKIINIHHSFLPGFKGNKPYHQAYSRGVKIIGATAHFVTKDLDEGPIIEQDVEHVSHAYQPNSLAAVGRDTERRVLAKAVKLFAEDRIFVVGVRTVIL